MALKALVALANAVTIGARTGALLGVYDDAQPLPPLTKNGAGDVVAKFKATAGQGTGQVWSEAVEDFVTPPAVVLAKEAVEAGGVALAYARWKMWADVQVEMTAGGNTALATYAGSRKTIWRALLVQAVVDHQAAT